MVVRIACLSLLLASAPAGAETLTTTVPFDTLAQCVRDRLTATGRVTAINTAAGVLLEYAFDAVAADGRVAPAKLGFTIEDHGTARTIAVAAPNPADAPLAQQYLKLAGGRCIAGNGTSEARPLVHGAP